MSVHPHTRAAAREKLFRPISYTLVFLMMSCIVLTLSVLVRSLLPGWHAGIMAGILLFIILDRLYIHKQLKSLTPLSSEWAVTLGVQWVVIALVSRFLLSYANGPASLTDDLSHWVRGSLGSLFTAEFVITLLLATTLWVMATQFLNLLDEIGLDMKASLSEEPVHVQTDIVPAHQRMVNLTFTSGIVLVILTALTRLNLQTVISSSSGLPPIEWSRFSGAEAGALLYFVFGLALLSLSRLMSLQTHWDRLRIPVSSSNLPRQWAVYSLIFLIALAVVVSLLPAGDSLGLFSVLGTLMGFLVNVLIFLSQVILGLVLMLLSLPFVLFGKTPPVTADSEPPPMPVFPQAPEATPYTNPAFELIRSILLWSGLILLIVYSLIRFVRQHDSLLAALRRNRITNWLVLAWQWLYRNVDRTRESLTQAIADGWQRVVSRLGSKRLLPRPGWISLRSLDPRRRVYFFYLAMIRRAGEQGLARRPSQTPAEYASHLEQAVPAVKEDIDVLTQAFIEARYSRQDIEKTKASLAKATWERIRRALRGKAKENRAGRK
jgi:hypothetical protein